MDKIQLLGAKTIECHLDASLFECCIHTCVASVLCRCCVYFIMVFKCYSGVFVDISDAYFKCCIYLQMYVACVASGCFKSRSDVASPSSLSVASPCCLLLSSYSLWQVGHPPPPPPLIVIDAGNVQDGAGPAWARKRSKCPGIRTPLSVRTSEP
jgi:hypothetical protein